MAKIEMLYLCVEVAGCPTVCRHCWAQGTGYGMMPLADIEWVLEEAHRFCDGHGPLPAPDELAARYGDADGLGVHLYPGSVRYLWLDRAQRRAGKFGGSRPTGSVTAPCR